MTKGIAGGLLLAVALGGSSSATAGVVTFTDRSVWTAAVASVAYTVDFDGIAAGTSFRTTALDVGPFTLSSHNPVPGSDEVRDTAALPDPVPPSFGLRSVYMFVDGEANTTVDLVFAASTHGFFADFGYPGNTSQLVLTLSMEGGGSIDLLVPGIGSTIESFGFTSTDAVTSIRLLNTVNDGFDLDNVSAAGPTGSTVPEPATLTLVGIGLAGLAGRRLRRRQ